MEEVVTVRVPLVVVEVLVGKLHQVVMQVGIDLLRGVAVPHGGIVGSGLGLLAQLLDSSLYALPSLHFTVRFLLVRRLLVRGAVRAGREVPRIGGLPALGWTRRK